jgi:hypothetical protein
MIRQCTIGILSLALMLAAGCSSSSKMLKHRQYDAAIYRSVKALSDDPGDQKEINVLAKAYAVANELDNDRIKYLKQSKEPQVWEEIYGVYSRLKSRQDQVKPLDAAVLAAINFKEIDYDQDLIDSKQKAADFLFGQGKKLLVKNNRYDAREAYGYFTKVKEFLPAYSGVDDKIAEAYGKSFAYVYMKILNNSSKALPRAFEEDVVKIGLGDNASRWLVFDTRYDAKTKYDYIIVLNLRKIEISPELMASADFTETKEAEDGLEYVLDAKGNVTKDSLGNDVKRTKYKTLKCYITKFSLGKTATVGGTLDFMNAGTGQMIKTDPVSAQWKFEFAYALVKGDKDALSPETKKLTELKIAPFPSNEDMILRTSEALKDMTKGIIQANMRLLE